MGVNSVIKLNEEVHDYKLLFHVEPARIEQAEASDGHRKDKVPVREPVWEEAALAAASVRPALMTIIGFVRATSRAAERKDRASPMDSI